MLASVFTPQVIGLLAGAIALAAGIGLSAYLLERRAGSFAKKGAGRRHRRKRRARPAHGGASHCRLPRKNTSAIFYPLSSAEAPAAPPNNR